MIEQLTAEISELHNVILKLQDKLHLLMLDALTLPKEEVNTEPRVTLEELIIQSGKKVDRSNITKVSRRVIDKFLIQRSAYPPVDDGQGRTKGRYVYYLSDVPLIKEAIAEVL